jgi:hypothetical protein
MQTLLRRHPATCETKVVSWGSRSSTSHAWPIGFPIRLEIPIMWQSFCLICIPSSCTIIQLTPKQTAPHLIDSWA